MFIFCNIRSCGIAAALYLQYIARFAFYIYNIA